MKTFTCSIYLMILPVFLFLGQLAVAQDYKALSTDGEYFFHNPANNSMIAIRIDSTKIVVNDVYYYNFKQIRHKDYNCAIPNGSSWLGDPVVENPDGTFLFRNIDPEYGNQTDSIFIKSKAGLNQSWVLYRYPQYSDYIEAQVTALQNSTFLGIVDSVKVISLQHKDASGQLVQDELNGQQLKLSKHHGLIRLPKFDEFPTYAYFYDIAGMTNPPAGNVNPDIRSVFDFEPGDEIHTHYLSSSFGPFSSTEINSIKKITGKSISPLNDWISYKYDICWQKTLITSPDLNPQYESGQQQVNDTIWFNSSLAFELSKEPDEAIINPAPGWMYTSSGLLKLGRSAKFLDYNYPFSPPIPGEDCWNMVMVDGCCNPYYITGLGGPYYDCPSYLFWYTDILEIVFYKKGSETWGTPFDCDSLLQVGLPELPHNQQLSIYPNPTSGEISISVPADLNFPLWLDVFDLSGRRVAGFRQDKVSQTYDI